MARCRAVALAYLPNKKILFLIVFILLIFAGWFYFSDYENKQAEYIAEKEKSPFIVVPEPTSSFASSTSDWLLTLPQDNFSGREDLVAQEKAVSDSKQNTLTAAYARKFLTDYMTLKKQKGELSDLDKQSLVQSFMDSLNPLVATDAYNISNIKISNGAGETAIRKYAGEIKKIFIDDKQGLISDTETFKTLMKNIKEGAEFQKNIDSLNYSIGKHEELIKKLLALTVPKELSENHLKAINGFNNVKFSIKNMVLASTDPVKAVMGRKLYDVELKRAYDSLIDMQSIFDKYKIYVFNNL